MKFIGTPILVITLLFSGIALSGCVDPAQMQSALNNMDNYWGVSKNKILAENGSKIFPVPLDQSKKIISTAITSLGFKLVQETDRSIRYTARDPLPFTAEEYMCTAVTKQATGSSALC